MFINRKSIKLIWDYRIHKVQVSMFRNSLQRLFKNKHHLGILFEIDKPNQFLTMNQCVLITGVMDSSGIRFHVTRHLRPYDSGIMELGLEYTNKMAIPPGQSVFTLPGYCIPECTNIVSQYRENMTSFKIVIALKSLLKERPGRGGRVDYEWQRLNASDGCYFFPGSMLCTCMLCLKGIATQWDPNLRFPAPYSSDREKGLHKTLPDRDRASGTQQR